MYARSTTLRGDPSRMDEGIAMVKDEVVPAVEGMDGCVGVSMLVDRSTGMTIVTTAWRDQESMRATTQRVEPLRQRAADLFAGTPEVREWEIALLHRERGVQDGACARVTWTRGDPAHADRNIGVFRDTVLPRAMDLDGFCSASLLVDRAAGTAAAAVVFRDRAAVLASREAAKGIRAEGIQKMGVEVLAVEELEVAHAHLRVPETV